MATVKSSMTLLSPRPNRKSVSCGPCRSVRRAVGRFWRKFVADQEPQDKERARQRRIDSIMHDVILLEAMRRWELENKNQEVSKDGPFSKE
jgi:hypothetical protein